MLPKKIPNYLLVIVWLASLVPYLLIKLWLVRIPAWFYGADTIAEIVTNALLAFFTAFPFWWLIDWFQQSSRASTIAQIQRDFLNQCQTKFNNYVSICFYSEEDSRRFRNHFAETSHNQLLELLDMDRCMSGREKERFKVNVSSNSSMLIMMGFCSFDIRQCLRTVAPFRGELSLLFNKNIDLLIENLDVVDRTFNRYKSDDKPDDTAVLEVIHSIVCVRHNLICLENQYRVEHELGDLLDLLDS